MNRDRASTSQHALAKFTRTAGKASQSVIREYSTSFDLATQLLGARHRTHVRNIYALVRIADEIVDGVAADAGLDERKQREVLRQYRYATEEALRVGYSTDVVVHAFARTARSCGITRELTDPFFHSMEMDIVGSADEHAVHAYTAEEHAKYVYGSAEVVGLMCLRVFLRDSSRSQREIVALERGARKLGSAFQNINFLRDLGDDHKRLQRSYLVDGARLTEHDKKRWASVIYADLAGAERTFSLLPKDARAAVRSAHGLFRALAVKLSATPVDVLYENRVRVPKIGKLAIVTRAVAKTALEMR